MTLTVRRPEKARNTRVLAPLLAARTGVKEHGEKKSFGKQRETVEHSIIIRCRSSITVSSAELIFLPYPALSL